MAALDQVTIAVATPIRLSTGTGPKCRLSVLACELSPRKLSLIHI